MKILVIQGSPRPDGNTQAVLDTVLAAAEQAGAKTQTVQLSRLKGAVGCMECRACKQHRDEPGCAVDDGIAPILSQAVEADLILWATPVFCWSPSWLIKMVMDRFSSMFKFEDTIESVRSLLDGKKMAAVITAAGGEKDGADLVAETCRRMAQFSKCDWLGALTVANVVDAATIRADADLTERAGAFGSALVSR